ncbi:alpha-1,2-fucosyltransferase [Treponema primitia ZAS-2]|uniref:Alpha-1,2-fucosyltransferase n=1 Tax=Treponema primitia (strain ATCC BAA-887 / DSM 12427 / ZAS-2) TaxID=545694 RepID=F5YQA5_TREPZ|nr:alpha-1,2-fucosyltransferase [Treponema primitia]AEF83667.1 alpha-1,2-fucosyltransferase [Treponema primitia ZAS-2]
MILFWSDGGLGNQFFQYVFIKTLQQKNENVIIFGNGFKDIDDIFEKIEFTKIKYFSKIISFCMNRIAKSFICYLAYNNVISYIFVKEEYILSKKYQREGDTVSFKKGLFTNIKYIESNFFQSEIFFNKEIVGKIKLKQKFIIQAERFIQMIPVGANKIFVHIRRGDYENFKVCEKSVILPFAYFHSCIKYFLEVIENPYFIFLSDEINLIKTEFTYLENMIISENQHYGVDFAIMTLCNNAILSPSSFSWWGSYLMKNKDIILAPKYWMGFASRIEFQKNPLASYMKIVDVETFVIDK